MRGSWASRLILTLANTVVASEFQATCNDDSTIEIFIPFDREAEILDLKYGSCDKDSGGLINHLESEL